MFETEGDGNQPQSDDSEVLQDNDIESSQSDDQDSDNSPEPNESEDSGTQDDEQDESSDDQGEESQQDENQADTFDEFLGTLTQSERKDYAKRYPNAWKRAIDPQASEDDRQLLIDKINTDLEYKRLKDQTSSDGDGEPTLEEQDEEEAPAQVNPAEQRKQYQAFVDSVVSQRVDPEAAKQLGLGLLQAFGVNVEAAKDDPEIKALVDNAGQVGQILAKGAVDLQYSTLPTYLPQMLEMAFPGITDMYDRSMHAMTWDSVRAYTAKDKSAPFSELPDYGTKEYRQLMKKAAATIPNFEGWEFKDKSGRPYPPQKQAFLKLHYLAQVATGQKQPKPTPKEVDAALETGKKLARQTEQKKQAGRALGSGQGNRQFISTSDESSLARGARIARERDSSIF